ncbi:MAG: Crp/Fnr family transcriptional regulator [Hominenteromicrobium sp.]
MPAKTKTEQDQLILAFRLSTLFGPTDITHSDAFFRVFRRGETISAVQDGISCVGVLAFGEADVYTLGTAETARQNVSTLHAGSEFGICNVFLSRDMPTCLHCKVRTGVAFLPKTRFIALLESDSALLRRYLELCNRKILYLADKVELMGIPGCRARVAAYLLRRADETGLAETEVSKEQLAKYLSVSRASLFRALSDLTAQGLIAPTPGGFKILDKTALSRI